ncbi:NAD(P)/FAD-dependent oxidoreductase [Variovorax sp. ZT4R33]|uniref:NAD(P)/FAD-dependent oxidoreductase n=1 Tax=Variovorax sp. ZT4R33 TaxID=3443743 RepID=UPI003F45334E
MQHDAIAIGGSFAGLSAAMQLARARRTVCVVDAGEPRNRFAAASHGFFGQDGMAPQAMIAQARDKLLAYPSVRFVAARAVAAEAEGAGGFVVTLDSGQALRSRKLLLAFGVQDGLPAIAGLRERWGASVLHCPYCHGYEFGGQRLGVLYRVPMSVHQALLISDWGPTTLFLDGEPLDDDARARLSAKQVHIESGKVRSLEGAGSGLEAIRLADGRAVPLDALYLAPSVRPGSALGAQLGCAFDDGPFGPLIRTDAAKSTTVPGVYAAGDAALLGHNATLASADGVVAGVALHQSLVFGE